MVLVGMFLLLSTSRHWSSCDNSFSVDPHALSAWLSFFSSNHVFDLAPRGCCCCCCSCSVDSVEEEVNQELKTLMDEVYLLGSMSHPNIMRFCAVCLDPPMIVTQYYPHGSLFDLLKKGRRGEKRAVQVSRVQG